MLQQIDWRTETIQCPNEVNLDLFLLSSTFQATLASQNFKEKPSSTFEVLTYFNGMLNIRFCSQNGLEIGEGGLLY